MPTPSSGVNPPSSSAGNPYVVPSDFRGRDAASNSNRSGGNSVTVTVPVSSTANINTQSSSNKATLETMAKNIADNTACLQGILKELKQMSDAINEQTRRSFSIEHSSYKEDLLVACGTLFGNTIHRSPAKTSIQLSTQCSNKKCS
eukprot:Em0019g405a